MVSVFKRYIHVEPLLNRTSDQLVAAYTTHRWFQAHGHHPEFQILDNEAPTPLLTFFSTFRIAYQMVPPFTKRANKAERAIQTFKRHFIAVLAGTHPSFPIDRWSELLGRTHSQHDAILRRPARHLRTTASIALPTISLLTLSPLAELSSSSTTTNEQHGIPTAKSDSISVLL